MCTKNCTKLAWVRPNSIAADVKPMLDAQAIYGLIRNTETSEIRILLYKQPPNFAHTMTYVSTYSRHKNGNIRGIKGWSFRLRNSYFSTLNIEGARALQNPITFFIHPV